MTGVSAVEKIPHEIWRQIACYLRWKVLRRMISVNRAFYNLVLDKTYRTVEWKNLDMDTIQSIGALSNPDLALRVHELEVSLSFIRTLYMGAPNTSSKASVVRGSSLPLSFHVQHVKDRVSNSRSPTRAEIRERTQRVHHGQTNQVRSDVEIAIKHMVNLRACVLDLKSFTEAVSPFADILAKTLNYSKLRRLVLHCDSTACLNPIITSTCLESLEELELKLDLPAGMADNLESEMSYIVTNLPPWINRMASNLTSLHLLSPYHLGTDELFDKFGRFPRLTRLVLSPLWVDGSLNTTPILKFISEQTPQLADLSLIPQSKHAFWTPFITQLKDQSLPLPQLKALSLSHLPDDFDVVLTLIRQTLDTLECLSLQECRLSYDKFLALATTLGGAPSSCISSLTLDVEILCPAILDTLYRQLPSLQSLEVVYKGIGGTYLNQYGKAQLKDVRPTSIDWNFPIFTTPMTINRYPDWKLSNFGAWDYAINDSPPRVSARQIMLSVAEAVPGLSMLRGKPLRAMEFHGMTPH